MKKIKKLTTIVTATTIAMGAIFCTGTAGKVMAANQTPIVKVDGKEIPFPDAQPYVNGDNRTMVPARFVTEALGCSVEWEDTRQLVTITKPPYRITFQIGENSAIVNDGKSDVRKEFDTSAVLKEERTFVPLRFISETLGAGVAWDEAKNTAFIRSDGKEEPVAAPGGWTVGDEPNMEKKQIQVLNGMTLEIALADPVISNLMELPGLTAVLYSGAKRELISISYAEYHKDGVLDTAMKVEYTHDMKNVFFDVRRDSEETRDRLKSAIAIIFPDSQDMQERIYEQIIAYKNESGYLGYHLNEDYGILVKKNITTWSRDDDSMGIWCSVFDRR